MPEGLPTDESARELYEHAPCGYLTVAPDGRVSRVNATFLAWTRLERDAVVGQRFSDLLTPGGRFFHENQVAPMLRLQGIAREVALDIDCPAGALPVLLNAVALRDADEELQEIRMVLLDARERRSYERELLAARRAESAARQRAERLQRLGAALLAAQDREAVGAAAFAELGPLVQASGAALVSRGAVAWQHGDVPSLPASCTDVEVGERLVLLALHTPAEALGLLALVPGTPPEPDDADVALLVAGAQQCAQALERVLLHESTEAAGRRAALLARVGSELSELRTVPERVDRLVELVVPVVADAAVIDVPADGTSPGAFALAGTPTPEAMQAASSPADRLEPDIAVLPLRGRGRSLGALVLTRRRGRPFDAADHEHLRDIAARAGLAIDNARLAEHERSVAHELQRSLLAGEPPRDARLRVATHYRPAVAGLEVGGDWYDAFPVAGDRVAVVVGDVVGRGVQAASAMGQLRSAIRALAAARLSPGELLERLDRFVEHQDAARMATLVYVELDLDSGVARYACAGHPPPLLGTASGVELLWGGRSAPLGAYAGAQRRPEARLTLVPGDRLLLYTDGLVERRDRGLDVRLAELVDAVRRRHDVPPGLLVRRVAEELLDGPPEDDVCLLAVAYGVSRRFERVVAADPEELAPLRADLRTWLAGNDVEPADRSAFVLACAEAVANGIEHGVAASPSHVVTVQGELAGDVIELRVHDDGGWLDRAPDPDRGRGLIIMRALMDVVEVERGNGTLVRLRRKCAVGARAA